MLREKRGSHILDTLAIDISKGKCTKVKSSFLRIGIICCVTKDDLIYDHRLI